MPKRIDHVPAHKHMTLDEIADFIADFIATGARGTDIPTGRLSFGGKLQQLTLVVDPEQAPPSSTDQHTPTD